MHAQNGFHSGEIEELSSLRAEYVRAAQNAVAALADGANWPQNVEAARRFHEEEAKTAAAVRRMREIQG